MRSCFYKYRDNKKSPGIIPGLSVCHTKQSKTRVRQFSFIAGCDRFRHTVCGMISLEVKNMTTKNIYERVAEQNHTTPEEVEKEIRQALELAHIEMDPETLILAIAQQIRS